MVAGAQSGMAVPPDEGTKADVAAVYHRECAVSAECGKGEVQWINYSNRIRILSPYRNINFDKAGVIFKR